MSKVFERKLDEYLENKTTRPLGRFTVEEAADFFGVERMTVYQRIYRGQLKYDEMEGKKVITKDQILAYMRGE